MADEYRHFKIFEITPNTFAQLSREDLNRFLELSVSLSRSPRWWADPDGLRFSLTNCGTLDGKYLYGTISQQYRIEQHLYSDDKRETSGEVDSYEDRLFVIHSLTGHAVIEWKQFRKQPPLSMPLLEVRAQRILTDLLREIGYHQDIKLVPVELETSKQEMIRIFYSTRVLKLTVEAFGSDSIPEYPEVILVNPIPHLEGCARDLVGHDEELDSLYRMHLETRSRGHGDLSKSAIARMGLHSGQPDRLHYVASDGHVHVRRRVQGSEFDVSVPIEPTMTAKSRADIAERVIRALETYELNVVSSDGVPQLALTSGED